MGFSSAIAILGLLGLPSGAQDKPKAQAEDLLVRVIETRLSDEAAQLFAAQLSVQAHEIRERFNVVDRMQIARLTAAVEDGARESIKLLRPSIRVAVAAHVVPRLKAADQSGVIINGQAAGVSGNPGTQTEKEKLRITVTPGLGLLNMDVTHGGKSLSASIEMGAIRPDRADGWRRGLQIVLTPKQRLEYTKYRKERLQNAIADTLLASLRYDLELTTTQLPAVRTELLKQIRVTEFEQMVTVSAGLGHSVGLYRKQLKPDSFAEILTPAQKHLWKLAHLAVPE